ncbi:TetR family transcriptional regulator C-terminal domain-containing protein [Actinoplanes sp. TRM 88003]|uniref:TetR family transcriptional regulator C-terminal domain-containing protein n=1 Tax=Paractinoplanes aksuensis TaxID=2939490 RepID=A0ABT1DT58_9ACTN|nr:TetR-like C-terminal domain-containing protein [Actinoplanes aksuensis]MCO8274012.1 TetR family transcriptional regulator C-terminal domain-containing protein [Actinoplanes aksuensis]
MGRVVLGGMIEGQVDRRVRRSLLIEAFTQWRRHSDCLQLVMRLENQDQVMDRIRLHVGDVMTMFARYGREDVGNPPLLGYVVDYHSGGLFRLLKSWLDDGCVVPAEAMADLVYDLSMPSGRNQGRSAAAAVAVLAGALHRALTGRGPALGEDAGLRRALALGPPGGPVGEDLGFFVRGVGTGGGFGHHISPDVWPAITLSQPCAGPQHEALPPTRSVLCRW